MSLTVRVTDPDETLATIEQRHVAQGAALLDVVCPTWWLAVDPYQLDASDDTPGKHCVLWYAYGDYQTGLTALLEHTGSDALDPEADREERYQFAAAHGLDSAEPGGGGGDFPALTEAWLDEVQARRWAATAQPLRSVDDGDAWAGLLR